MVMHPSGGERVDIVQVAGLWEENQEYLRQRLGYSDYDRFGARWVYMPDAPFPRFNHVSRIRVPAGAVDALIDECRLFYYGNGLHTCCLMVTPATNPPDLGAQLYRRGFTSETNPVMIWDGSPVVSESPFIRVEEAGPEQAEQVFDLIRRVFFPSGSGPTISMGRRGVAISYEIGARNYIAYWGTRPAGAGMLFPYGAMGGIYNMCTLPEFRGRGVATAIMAACLAEAGRMGCTHVGLTPTPLGRPLYERLGFRQVYQERYYVERLY